jgi:predicted HD phosphohydrolase
MKLQEGAYENLITSALKQDIQHATEEGLVCKEDAIDDAESPSLLAAHVHKMINRKCRPHQSDRVIPQALRS